MNVSGLDPASAFAVQSFGSCLLEVDPGRYGTPQWSLAAADWAVHQARMLSVNIPACYTAFAAVWEVIPVCVDCARVAMSQGFVAFGNDQSREHNSVCLPCFLFANETDLRKTLFGQCFQFPICRRKLDLRS